MKNSKGITLVALVVTIIVLLILAGVSLRLVAGGDGIMNRAKNAADTNYRAEAKEEAELLIANYVSDWYEAKYVTTPRTSDTCVVYVINKLGTTPGTTKNTTGSGNYTVVINTPATETATSTSITVSNVEGKNRLKSPVTVTGTVTIDTNNNGKISGITWNN